MKRKICTIVSLLIMLFAFNNGFAIDVKKVYKVTIDQVDVYFYILSEEEKTVEITTYTIHTGCGKIYDLNIPSEIIYNELTYSVESIADDFYAYHGSKTAPIRTINIPNSVKYIKANAFKRESVHDIYSNKDVNIDVINLPPTLLEIGEFAFYSPDVVEVELPPMHGGYYIDYLLHDITSPLIISNYIEKINEQTFRYSNFSNVTLGRNITTLESQAFGSIENLICCATNPPKGIIAPRYLSNLLVPPGCKEVYEQDENCGKAASIEEYEYYVDAEFEEGNRGVMLKDRALKLNPVITWRHDGSTERYRVWTSSDESVATVSQAGVIVSRNYGNTTITFTIEDERGVPFDCIYNVEVTNEAGLSDIFDDDTDTSTAVEVFTLNGLKVGDSTDNLSAGLYIVKSAKEAKKIYIK